MYINSAFCCVSTFSYVLFLSMFAAFIRADYRRQAAGRQVRNIACILDRIAYVHLVM